ncbi:MAG TPA: hypothetical protein DCX06_00125 [Opitutae bacterium]|nr:hypothetical protein [Opitutae bacterium]
MQELQCIRLVVILLLVLSHCKQLHAVESKPHFPDFSWQTIPRWGFLSFEGDSITNKEANYIAMNYPIATLFWLPRGHIENRQQAESQILRSAKQIKEINPTIRLLYYWNSTLANDHYSAFREFEAKPSWMMTDKHGEPVTVRGDVLRYNVADPGLRDWWSEHAAKAVRSPYLDGIFADAVAKVELNRRNVYEAKMRPGDFEDAVAGMHTMLALTQQKMGEGKLLVYNGIRGDLRPGMWSHGGAVYLKEADGACMEHFLIHSARRPSGELRVEHVLLDIELIRAAAAQGKLVLVKAWPQSATFLDPHFKRMSNETKKSILKEELLFPLSLFLIAAEENCYFNYGFGYRRECLPLHHLSEYDQPLGAPLEAAVQTGMQFSRRFEHATVRVDLKTQIGQINWHDESP